MKLNGKQTIGRFIAMLHRVATVYLGRELPGPGIGAQKDDMDQVLEKMAAADLLPLAAPVYFDTMPSDMKRLFERLMPSLGPVFEFRNGRTYHLF